MKKEVIIVYIFVILLVCLFVYSANPSITSVFLNSSDNARNTTLGNLSVNFTITDTDGSNIKNVTVWNINGVSLPVLYAPFENNSNDSLTEDYSTFHMDGNVTRAVWNSTAGYDGFGAYNFSSSYINFGVFDALKRRNHTFGGWVKIDTNFDYGGEMVIMGQINITGKGAKLYTDGTSFTCTDGIKIVTDIYEDQIYLNRWYHVMCWHNQTRQCLYINGNKSCSSTTGNTDKLNETEFVIGGSVQQDSSWFNGTVDEVYIFNRSLSDEQVKFLYENKTDLLSSFELSAGSIWNVSITLIDSTQEKGSQTNSTSLKILLTSLNITLEPNITQIDRGFNYTFNCSAYILDDINSLLNVSFMWYEENSIIISNNTVGSNMSNYTNQRPTTFFSSWNLTGGNYRLGYNYSCGVYACKGTECMQTNSSRLYVNNFIVFTNITLDPNITSSGIVAGTTFRCSSYITDHDFKNVSFMWYEEDSIIISNNTNGFNMSNYTNIDNSSLLFSSANLTRQSYRLGYNYSCGVYACDGEICVQGNSTRLFINFSVEKLNYLGKGRMFAIEFDDMTHQDIGASCPETSVYRRNYEALIDFYNLYDQSNGTKYSWGLILRPELNPTPTADSANLTDPRDNFKWVMADSEYDKRITVCAHGDSHNGTEKDANSLSANNTILAIQDIYNEVIGRNFTCWKFPGYRHENYGRSSMAVIPYVSILDQINDVSQHYHNITNTGSLFYTRDVMGATLPTSFTNNYVVGGHHSCKGVLTDSLNLTSYFDDLLTLINYAEGQTDIAYLSVDEMAEVFDMWNYTNMTTINMTAFSINSDATYWTYRKRLAINLTGVLDDATHPYIQITTPSGMKVAQNMTTYTGTGIYRSVLVIIPVENGTYSITNFSIQPTDPSFRIENLTIYANNTILGFNGSNYNNSAHMIFKVVWTGTNNVWGDYNNTNTDFNITHGYKFNQSKGDNWFVEHDAKSGKLHILGASNTGTEYIHAELPFTFSKYLSNSTNKKYILNATGVFKNITASNLNLSIPEDYDSSWTLNVSYANGTNIITPFYRGGSVIFSVPIIQEDQSIVIDYFGLPPTSPPSGSSPSSRDDIIPIITPPVIPVSPIVVPDDIIIEDLIPDPIREIDVVTEENEMIIKIITESGIESILKLIMENVGLTKLKPKLTIDFKSPEIKGLVTKFSLFEWINILIILIIITLCLFLLSFRSYVKSGIIRQL